VIIAAGLISTQLGAVVGVAYLIAATLDPLVPKSYFRAAQIFNDRLLDPQKAKKSSTGVWPHTPTMILSRLSHAISAKWGKPQS